MSMSALSWAFNQRPGDPVAKVVLMAVADLAPPHYSREPYVGHSLEAIAEWAECDIEAVVKALAHLAGRGFIRWSASNKRPDCAFIEILIPKSEPEPELRGEIPTPAETFVYVAQCGDLSKVGISRQPEQRIAGLSSPVAKIELVALYGPFTPAMAGKIEAAVHTALGTCAVGREWFRVSPTEAMAAVARLENAMKGGAS